MILASSLHNFIQLSNPHAPEKPFVTFSVSSPTNVKIVIADADNADGYRKEIVASPTAELTSNSFRTSGVIPLNLLECLKLNPIFYNITLQSASVVKAYIDTSINYSVTVSGGGITVGGSYSSYNAVAPSKMVVMMNGSIDGEQTNIVMEKYNDDTLVSFDLTAPFSHSTTKYPFDVSIAAYQVYDSTSSMLSVPYSTATIMPTTLTKFQTVDWSLYYNNYDTWYPLTNRMTRDYNYGEVFCLSALSDQPVSIIKGFYTNSGVYLETQYDGALLVEQHGLRWDVYDRLDLEDVERRYNRQVGYVNVMLYSSSNEGMIVKFVINPKCKDNNEVFFLNELGGIDSYNFNNVRSLDMSIDDSITYFKNPVAPFTDTLEIEASLQKRVEHTHILSSHQVDGETATWLGELQKTKHAFLFLGTSNPKFKTIIIDKLDIQVNNDDNAFELELEYHDSDNKLYV